jgi:hypothetical protein
LLHRDREHCVKDARSLSDMSVMALKRIGMGKLSCIHFLVVDLDLWCFYNANPRVFRPPAINAG